jgi:hypothetical protein
MANHACMMQIDDRVWLTGSVEHYCNLILVSGLLGSSNHSDRLCYHYPDFGIWCSKGVSYPSRFLIGTLHSIDVSYARKLRL